MDEAWNDKSWLKQTIMDLRRKLNWHLQQKQQLLDKVERLQKGEFNHMNPQEASAELFDFYLVKDEDTGKWRRVWR